MSYFLSNTVAKRTVSIAARCAPRALTVAQINPALTSSRLARFSSAERAPEEDYIDGHLVTDHLEYLDDMIGKTLEIENNMDRLRETYAEKRKTYNNSASLEEMEKFFLQVDEQKRLISAQISSLKTSLAAARKAAFAVDGPDGTSDELEQLYTDEANEINAPAVKAVASAEFAVDAPDGTSDELEKLYVTEADAIEEATREEASTMGGKK